MFKGARVKIDKFYLNDGTYIRFKKIGKGPPILLLHTFRNRLEYSDKLGKLLEDKFTVYSIDLPGFGDSPINTNTNYNLNFFTKSIVYFIKKLKIKNLTIAGESIGATLAASVSVELPKVVKKIFMFNTYDYDSFFGEGIQRGNFFAKFILFHVSIPVIGILFCSLENKFILKNIMNGGFFDKTKLSDNYLNLLCTSLKKKGYVYHFRKILSHFNKNSGIRELYKSVTVPVRLFYGSNDWAKETEKLQTQNLLKLDKFETIDKSGHFSFLENTVEVSKLIKT
jgi:pimeloyl-ACP methyl ester carboxylesterase